MTHQLRMERRDGTTPWWACDHCHDAWSHVPDDVCTVLLRKLEAEQAAGWTTVTAPTGDVYELLRHLANASRNAAA